MSTDRQAGNELSLVDQQKQLRKACAERGWEIVAEYSEAESAFGNKRRPEFDKFYRRATSSERPFDILFVHSLSRYSRDMLVSEQGFQDLARVGVEIISLTEDIQGESGWMLRRLISMFSEQSSRETSKHVKRTRIENARQGFWNGGPPPLGLKAENAGMFGDKVKRKLVEDTEWSPLVRLIFKLHREGDGEGHPLGATGIGSFLNRQNYRTKSGGLWHVSLVHRILTNEAYVGRVYMNKTDKRTGLIRPREEWVYSPAPPLVSEQEFQETQVRLMERRPDHQAPRITTSDVILGGIAYCAGCGGSMGAATGTGKNGTVYNYYVCSRRALRGPSACPDPQRVRRDELDNRVLDAVAEQLLTPGRLHDLINAVSARRKNGEGDAAKDLIGAKEALAAVEKKLGRLVKAVIEGTLSESETVRQTQHDLETEKDRISTLIKLRTVKLRHGTKLINADEAESLAMRLRRNLTNAPPQLARRYARALIGRVEVSRQEIRILGSTEVVADALSTSDDHAPRVQTSAREWRAK